MTLIEKMARAIHEASYHPDDRGSSIVAEHWEFEKDKAFKRAEAALSAIEPTETMIEAGRAEMPVEVDYWLDGNKLCKRLKPPLKNRAGIVFSAMINAAKEAE